MKFLLKRFQAFLLQEKNHSLAHNKKDFPYVVTSFEKLLKELKDYEL